MTNTKSRFSLGLSWAAVAVAVTVCLPTVYFGNKVSQQLGHMAATLENVSADLTDNKAEHADFRAAISDHETRIALVENR